MSRTKIVLAGEGGQGVQSIAKILVEAYRLWHAVRLQDVEEQGDARRIAQRAYRLSGRGAAQCARLSLRSAVEYPFGPRAQAYRHRRSAH